MVLDVPLWDYRRETVRGQLNGGKAGTGGTPGGSPGTAGSNGNSR